MKRCIKCNIEKPLDMFWKKAKNADGRDNKCGECSKLYHKKIYNENESRKLSIRRTEKDRIKRNKDLVFKIKSTTPCTDCGVINPIVTSFDHVRGKKEFNIADKIHNPVSVEKLLKEIKKCEIVCMNCHAIRTYNRRNSK